MSEEIEDMLQRFCSYIKISVLIYLSLCSLTLSAG